MLQGDGYARRPLNYTNARLIFRHGMQQASFVYHLYDQFIDFVDTPPKVVTIAGSGKFKERSNIWFGTLCYTCFNFYFDLFYEFYRGKYIKRIPNSIGNYLTPKALAYWLMCDGSKHSQGGIYIHTPSFSLSEVELLINVFKTKFHLISTYHTVTNKETNKIYYVIYIRKDQMETLNHLVQPYFIPSMLYKLHL